MKVYNDIINMTNKIRSRMQDDLSRKIYDCKIMNALTYDYKYITAITKDRVDIFSELRKTLDIYINKYDLIIDGAGYYGKSIKNTFSDIHWKCVCDRSKSGAENWDIPLLSRSEAVNKYPHAVFVISSMLYGSEIEEELRKLGVTNILNAGNILNKYTGADSKQYYDVFEFGDEEVIADVGCFDCNSVFQYFKYGNNKYKQIYSFEPEPKQYEHCKDIIKNQGINNWDIFNYGVYDSNSKLYFSSNSSCTQISDKGDVEVDVIKLDDFFKTHEPPTFIKMDIEGSELAELKGCAETIRKYKPKLAICVYHKPEDIFEIPEYILSLNPDYKMWLRHYTNLINETVLYCE